MPDWLIALPCWGEVYRKRFAEHCWPSWQAALAPIRDRCRIMLHTDDSSFARLFDGYAVDCRGKPGARQNKQHGAFADAHREALREAREGEIVAIQNADHILSVECFTAAEKRIAKGKKLIMCAGPRTVGPLFGNAPPVLRAAALLEWAMAHPHTITQQSTYPHGKSAVPSVLYFRDEVGCKLRAWHLHPFCAVKDRPLTFAGTVDRDLPDNFDFKEIHIVTDKNELAMAEISPLSRHFALRPDAMTEDYLFWWGMTYATPVHWNFFSHVITLTGLPGSPVDMIADKIMGRRSKALREAA